jgi:hypothetical protein
MAAQHKLQSLNGTTRLLGSDVVNFLFFMAKGFLGRKVQPYLVRPSQCVRVAMPPIACLAFRGMASEFIKKSFFTDVPSMRGRL